MGTWFKFGLTEAEIAVVLEERHCSRIPASANE